MDDKIDGTLRAIEDATLQTAANVERLEKVLTAILRELQEHKAILRSILTRTG